MDHVSICLDIVHFVFHNRGFPIQRNGEGLHLSDPLPDSDEVSLENNDCIWNHAS